MLEKQHMSRQPIDFTPELADLICDKIADGTPINQFAGKDGIPIARTIYRRMATDAEFARRVQIEREIALENDMQRCIAMADAASPEDCQVVKLRIQTRQWLAARMAPKKYGAQPEIAINNNLTAGGATTAVLSLSPQQEDDLQRLIAETRARVAICHK